MYLVENRLPLLLQLVLLQVELEGGGNKVLNTSSVTPVVPNTKPVNNPKATIPGTNVKVDANADIQMQAHQYLNSGQVKSAQANANNITASANQGNKKFEKQQQLLNKANEANQVLNAGGNTYVIGAKSTGDIQAAINNVNNGTVSWSKDIHGANTNPVNINQYQGQVTNKPTTKITQQGPTNAQQGTGVGKPTNVQQGTGVSGAEIKQQSQNLQGQRNPSEVTADEASRSTKLTVTKPKPKETVSNNTQQPANQAANTQQPNTNQPANTQQQQANNTQQQSANNTQSTNTGQNNNNNNNNNNSKTENKPNWWNRWGKTTAKVTAGVGAVGALGAGAYGLHEMHKMTSSDDR